jgi:hypothetical protein
MSGCASVVDGCPLYVLMSIWLMCRSVLRAVLLRPELLRRSSSCRGHAAATEDTLTLSLNYCTVSFRSHHYAAQRMKMLGFCATSSVRGNTQDFCLGHWHGLITFVTFRLCVLASGVRWPVYRFCCSTSSRRNRYTGNSFERNVLKC